MRLFSPSARVSTAASSSTSHRPVRIPPLESASGIAVAAVCAAVLTATPRPAMAAGGYTITSLATIPSGTSGSLSGVTLDSHGNLFGASTYGGSNGVGELYEIRASTTQVIDLADFQNDIFSYRTPVGQVAVDASGNLFAVCQVGGSFYPPYPGALMELPAGSGVVSPIAFFNGEGTLSDPGNGSTPANGVTIDSHGNLYGTASFGGIQNKGTVWEMPAGTTVIQPIYSNWFHGIRWPDAFSSPVAVDDKGNTYVTLSSCIIGPIYDHGIVVGNTPGPNLFTGGSLIESAFDGTNGSSPGGPLVIDSAGNLFGTAGGGAANKGQVYEVVAGTSTITTFASFTGANGSSPYGLVMDGFGNMFGIAEYGGADGFGSVFEIPTGTQTILDIADFPAALGARPNSGLAIDTFGNLYGTADLTSGSGGIVFKVSDLPSTTSPEPGTLVLILSGLAAGGVFIRRKRMAA